MGRPRLPRANKRKVRVELELNVDTYFYLKHDANRFNWTISQAVDHVVFVVEQRRKSVARSAAKHRSRQGKQLKFSLEPPAS